MRRYLNILPAMILIGAILAAPLQGKSNRFRLAECAILYVIELQPGEYELEIYDDVASIYQDKKLVAVAGIRIEPIAGATVNSTFCCDGVLKDVRLKDKRVLFIEPTIKLNLADRGN